MAAQERPQSELSGSRPRGVVFDRDRAREDLAGAARAHRPVAGDGITVALERDEFRFAPPLNQSPFVPAEAGTQGPRTRPKSWVPRGRTELRGDCKVSSSRATAPS